MFRRQTMFIMPTGSSLVYSDPPVILSLHGIYGSYDQALENVREFSKYYRIIVPSRFGYPGSAVAGEGSPKEQAAALMALLDILNIEQVYVLGASAGGTPALRFALDYPERTAGLILLSSAPPPEEKPRKLPTRMGPPATLNHDYVMWLLSPNPMVVTRGSCKSGTKKTLPNIEDRKSVV